MAAPAEKTETAICPFAAYAGGAGAVCRLSRFRSGHTLRCLCWRCGRGSRRFGAAVFYAVNAGRSPNPAALCRDGGAVFSCAFYKWQAVAASCGKNLSKHEKMRANLRKSASLACNKRGMIVLLNMYVKSISAAIRSGGIKRRKSQGRSLPEERAFGERGEGNHLWR